MAYKALYRKYRPQTFNEVAGQQHITQTLLNAVRENRIAHAYLFCGPRGTGKTTVAKLLAKAVNCTGEVVPCDACDNCISIKNGSNPDVIEIDAASNNGVEEVRNLIDKVKYTPTTGKYKVYIIDEVHMMSTGAFNALLKTLEEPPAHVIFILATTEPHKILPTIISRCQRYDFTKLSIKDIVDRLKIVVNEENYQCDDEALVLIARLSDGGMRDALSILEQCLAYNNEHLTLEDVNNIYGILSIDHKIHFIKTLIHKDMTKSLSLLEDMKSTGIDIKRLTNDLVDILKDVVIYKNTNDVNLLSVLNGNYVNEIVPYILNEDAFKFIDILMDASEKYSKVINPNIYFELAVLRICSNVQEVSVVSSVSKPVEDQTIKQEEPIQTEPVQEEPEIPTFEFEQEELVEKEEVNDDIKIDEDDILNIMVQARKEILAEVQEKWPIIKRYMSNFNTAKCASMLMDGKPVVACKGGLVIAYKLQPSVNAVNYYENYKALKQFLKDILSEEYDFVAMLEDDFIELKNKFIELRNSKSLPQPRSITFKHLELLNQISSEPVLNDAQQFAVENFGDLVELEED